MRIRSQHIKRLLWGLFLWCFVYQSHAQTPFEDGEVLRYELVYNWGIIWARAGYVEFSVHDTTIANQDYYHFIGEGSSYKNWDWFYKVRSKYEAYADIDLNSKRFIRFGNEGSNYYNRDYHVKPEAIYATFKDEDGTTSYKQMPPNASAKDVLTAIYYCRTFDFESMTENDTIPLTFYLDGEIYPSYMRFLGSEEFKHPKTKERQDCWVFKPNLIEGTVFKEGENMTVYVSKDGSNTPIHIETDLVIGKAKVFLQEESSE